MTTNILRRIDQAILKTEAGDHLHALTEFLEIYGTDDAPPLDNAKAASGLSFFGLSLALVQRKYKAAIDLCKRALDLEFYNGDHYANLTRVYVAAGNRKKAIETAEAGLKVVPDHEALVKVPRELGVRPPPPLPFPRPAPPIHLSLGLGRPATKT